MQTDFDYESSLCHTTRPLETERNRTTRRVKSKHIARAFVSLSLSLSLSVREAACVVRTEMSGKTSLVDVAFRATTLGLFATTVVSGAWFAATTAKGFMHYNAASEEARKAAGTGSASGGKGGGKS